MKTDVTKCPKCGCQELGIGKQNGYALVAPIGKMSFGSEIHHILCTDCGFVVESYVVKPEKFKDTF